MSFSPAALRLLGGPSALRIAPTFLGGSRFGPTRVGLLVQRRWNSGAEAEPRAAEGTEAAPLPKIEKALAEDGRVSISYKTFSTLLSGLGVGEVLHQKAFTEIALAGGRSTYTFDGQQYLVLDPSAGSKCLDTLLSPSHLSERESELRETLLQDQTQLDRLKKLHDGIEKKAVKAPWWFAWFGLPFAVGQYCVLFHFVFNTFDWNLMEPITFFIGYTTMTLGLLFYGLTKREYEFSSIHKQIVDRKREKLCIRNKVTKEQIGALQVKVDKTQRLLKAFSLKVD